VEYEEKVLLKEDAECCGTKAEIAALRSDVDRILAILEMREERENLLQLDQLGETGSEHTSGSESPGEFLNEDEPGEDQSPGED